MFSSSPTPQTVVVQPTGRPTLQEALAQARAAAQATQVAPAYDPLKNGVIAATKISGGSSGQSNNKRDILTRNLDPMGFIWPAGSGESTGDKLKATFLGPLAELF